MFQNHINQNHRAQDFLSFITTKDYNLVMPILYDQRAALAQQGANGVLCS